MNDDSLSYYIPLSRKVFDHEFWSENRTFSKFEAWIDLLQSARYQDSEKSEWINNKEVKFNRGQLIASVRFLQKRWNWGSITKVENFLTALKNKDMVDLNKGQGINVITICKYDSYNVKKNKERTVKGQGEGRQKDKVNKDNKDNTIVGSIDERKLEFSKSLIPFVKVYGKETVREFCDYWTEPNKSNTKFKKELQATWDTERRLKLWAKNDFGTGKSKIVKGATDQSQNKNLFA